MQVYATMDIRIPLTQVAAFAKRVEAMGYDGLTIAEALHNSINVSLLALEHTSVLKVNTGVLVAFARSPMLVAQDAWDLQQLSGGRFELGLGSQVKGNVVGRFSMPWSAPAPRMREYVLALRAIFNCWQNGVPLDFSGEHYVFKRMQPFFNPGPLASGPPKILLGAVNPGMTRVVGEVADAQMTHPTNSDPRYLLEVIEPALVEGARRGNRSRSDIEVMASPYIATGATPEDVDTMRRSIKKDLPFLYSTPAYRPTLELHGWAAAGEQLYQLSKVGKWAEMASVFTDEMFDTLVPTGTYAEIPGILRKRYDGLAQRITFPVPDDPADDAKAAQAIAAIRGETKK